jgi:hypothetical protein
MLKASALFLAMICCHSSAVLMKTEYAIGGWGPGEWDILYTKWMPIFETYLTETVGRHYDPPISFKLVAVDQTEGSSTQNMIEEGKIDFLCEWLDLFLFYCCPKINQFIMQTILLALLHARRRHTGE